MTILELRKGFVSFIDTVDDLRKVVLFVQG